MTVHLMPLPPRPGDRWADGVDLWLSRFRPVTRATYERQIGYWTTWCRERGIDPWEASKGTVESYLAGLGERLAEASVALAFDSVASCYRFLYDDELIEKDPCGRMSRPVIHRQGQRRTFLTPLQYAAFLGAARRLGPDEHAVAAIGGMMGLRSAEMCGLDVSSVGDQDAYTVIRFIGKGAKPAVMPLPMPVLRPVLHLAELRESGPLLRTKAGTRFCTRSMVRVVARICGEANLPRVTPHGLRRTFVTTGRSTGISDRDLMEASRHADPRTLAIYDMGERGFDRHASHRVAGFLSSYTD